MSSNRTKKQVSEKQAKSTTLRKIHLRIDKVKLILQRKDKNFYNKHSHLFDQLREPRQRFIDTINLNMDDGTIKPIKLFLVQHNLAFGPGQGVLRFIKHIHIPKSIENASLEDVKDVVEKLVLEEVEVAAMEKSLYHSLHNVKLGGASSSVALLEVKKVNGQFQIVPLELTKTEVARLSREIGYELVKHRIMGPDGFWPEPDNETTDEQILNWVEDEALRTLLLKHLLAPGDKELLETLDKVYGHAGEKNKIGKRFKNISEILETPYHDAALMWLKEWRATRRGEMAMEELVSETSKVGKQYKEQVSKTARKYKVIPSIAEDLLAVKRFLAVMYQPFRDYKPNGQIVILDTGIAPAIVQGNLSRLKELNKEDVVIISVLSKRLGGSSPKRIEQLCRIYVEAAYNLGAKIVTLCNTMDSNARAVVSKEFSIPVLGPIEPAVKAALRFGKAMNIGVIATKATIESGAYVREIQNHDPVARVFSVVAPLLATMADMGKSDTTQPPSMNQETIAILETNLRPLMGKNIDILILGCTHYSVFEQTIHDVWKRCTGKEIHIVDSSKELSLYTLTYLEQNRLLSFRVKHKGSLFSMASKEDTQKFEQGILKITGRNVEVIPMDIGEVVGRLSEKDRLFQKAVVKESKEDVNLRGVIINSRLSAEAKVATADKLYGAGSIDISRSNGEILPLELQEEYIAEMDKLAGQDKELSKVLSHIKELLSNKAK
ncbi:MAG: aspartate/glutamate racemase family protein [Candidatus Scalinduaceae bacterium]